MDSLLILTLAISILGTAALLACCLHRVPEGEAWIVQRRGRFARVLRPGLRFSWPLREKIAQHVKLIGHRVDLPVRNAFDPRATSQRATLYYQILEPERSGAQLADIDSVVAEAAREQAGALVSAGRQPEVLAERLKPLLNLQLGALGLRVTRCQLPGS
jgi:regulator of protease activity HflC (stomatin/prohibitin superfamily)